MGQILFLTTSEQYRSFSDFVLWNEFEIKYFSRAFWDAFIHEIRENLHPGKSKKKKVVSNSLVTNILIH